MPKYKVLEKEKELRAYFIKKRFINRYVAIRTFDVFYLWQCVWRMRNDGFEIKTEKGPNKQTRYRLLSTPSEREDNVLQSESEGI